MLFSLECGHFANIRNGIGSHQFFLTTIESRGKRDGGRERRGGQKMLLMILGGLWSFFVLERQGEILPVPKVM